jgi:hypothetical protein
MDSTGGNHARDSTSTGSDCKNRHKRPNVTG